MLFSLHSLNSNFKVDVQSNIFLDVRVLLFLLVLLAYTYKTLLDIY